MVDTNHSVRSVAEPTKNPDAEPPRHPCNDPDLGPLEFLLAVMREPTFPISVRIKAAEAAAPYLTPRPGESRHYPCVGHHLTYIIPCFPEDRPLRPDHDVTKDPEQINANSQSFSHSASNSPLASCGGPRPQNTERPFPRTLF